MKTTTTAASTLQRAAAMSISSVSCSTLLSDILGIMSLPDEWRWRVGEKGVSHSILGGGEVGGSCPCLMNGECSRQKGEEGDAISSGGGGGGGSSTSLPEE